MVPITEETWTDGCLAWPCFRFMGDFGRFIPLWILAVILRLGCFASRLQWRCLQGPAKRRPPIKMSSFGGTCSRSILKTAWQAGPDLEQATKYVLGTWVEESHPEIR